MAKDDLHYEASAYTRSTKKFPVVRKYELPPCFSCGSTDLTPASDDGYPKGEGQFRARCRSCGLLTWFDRLEKA